MAREKVAEQKDRLVSTAREKKDELVERAEQSAAAAPSVSTNASQTDGARPEHANAITQNPRQLAAEEPRQGWQDGDQPT
jgi:vacuolar-type H+-ATPase subunit H